MQIVIVTRHIARAATFYSPILKALQEDGTHVTLVGPAGTDAHIAERRGLRTREVALRPFGGRPVALEWAVLAGDLLKMGQDAEGGQTPLDVLMSFEEDLAPVVSMAARATRARLVVLASDAVAAPSMAKKIQRAWVPLWSKVQARTRAILPPEAVDGGIEALQDRLRALVGAAQALTAELPVAETARQAGEVAWESLEHAAQELRAYATAPPTHYLLRQEPRDWQPEAGWTDFRFGVGIDVDRFLAYGQGRTFTENASGPMTVGLYHDFFGERLERQAVVHDAQFVADAFSEDELRWRSLDASSLSPNDSLIDAQRSYLRTLDVAIVPADDLYAAMQAAAAGCVVVTAQDSRAASTFRDGESGFALPVLDRVQLVQVLRRLLVVERRQSMQDAAQRRALRLFDAGFFLRRLKRGMEENLQMGQGEAPMVERRMRRHI